jgi:hypothetical protein
MKEILSAQRLTMTVEAYAVYRERLLTEPERFEDANTAARIVSGSQEENISGIRTSNTGIEGRSIIMNQA